MREITVLAVTRISSGVCVAGVTSDGDWIRPTRPNYNDSWRQLRYDDCKDSRGEWVVRKGNRVKMDLVQPIPKGAHSEDWLIGSRDPVLVAELSDSDYLRICQKVGENSTDPIEDDEADRSLITVHPDEMVVFSFAMETSFERERKYVPRCSFRIGRRLYERVGISDAEWRSYGRQFLLSNGRTRSLSATEVFKAHKTKDCWLTLGRNQVRSNVYLLVTGVHLFPVRRFEMDFDRA